MRVFTDAGRAAIAVGNFHAGLTLALTLPDICGSLVSPGAKTGKRYKAWCRTWLEPRFHWPHGPEKEAVTFLTADHVYGLRNAFLHAGTAEFLNTEGRKMRVLLVAPDVPMDGNTFKFPDIEVRQIKVNILAGEIFDAVDSWDTAMHENAAVHAMKRNLLEIWQRGQIYRMGPIVFKL